MKTKQAVSIKKQTVAVKDLKTRKNPRGGRGGNPIASVPIGLEEDPGRKAVKPSGRGPGTLTGGR